MNQLARFKKVNLLCLFPLFFLLCFSWNTPSSSAKEQGFFINENIDHSLSIEATDIVVFSTPDKLIYPGSEGRSTFIVKNNSKLAIQYELFFTTDFSAYQDIPIQFIVKLDKETKQSPIAKTDGRIHELSLKSTLSSEEIKSYEIIWIWEADADINQEITELALEKELYKNVHLKLDVESISNVKFGPTESIEKSNYVNNRRNEFFPTTGESLGISSQIGCLVFGIALLFWIRKRK